MPNEDLQRNLLRSLIDDLRAEEAIPSEILRLRLVLCRFLRVLKVYAHDISAYGVESFYHSQRRLRLFLRVNVDEILFQLALSVFLDSFSEFSRHQNQGRVALHVEGDFASSFQSDVLHPLFGQGHNVRTSPGALYPAIS